ncbi:MAG: hypothetical protein H0T78_02030, partial [Longispora sp.]|nr:hypothetical protein [Longispora sp. (in: high G+C Gram-positive bacteria)]
MTWRDDKALLECFAGCHIDDIVHALGLTKADLFDEPLPPRTGSTAQRLVKPLVARQRSTRSVPPPKPASARKTKAQDELGAVLSSWKAVATYPYSQADNQPYGKVVRRERRREHGVEKTFAQYHYAPEHAKATKDGWAPGAPAQPILYRLPQVLEAVASNWPVYVCEGEKDADNLNGLLCRLETKAVATTNAGGAGTWNDTYTQALHGADIRLLIDRDAAGYRRGLDVFRVLVDVAASVQVFLSAIDEPKADLTDHLEAG